MGCADSKKGYLLLRSQVAAAVNLADPLGLLAMGCPPDEYDSETTLITARVVRCTSEADLCADVWGIFVRQFDLSTAGSKEHYGALAAALWKLRDVPHDSSN